MAIKNDYCLDRQYGGEMRTAQEENGGHIIEGLAAVYEQETYIRDAFGGFTEIIRQGAFDETDFDDVRLLVNHDMSNIPLARSRRNNKSDKPNTMKLTVDEKGVNIVANLDIENNEQARALYSAIDRGDVSGMSFLFFVSEDNQRWSKRDGRDYREILKVDKVVEVSVVNMPAYEGTTINSRSADSDRRAYENAYPKEEVKKVSSADKKIRQICLMYKQ